MEGIFQEVLEKWRNLKSHLIGSNDEADMKVFDDYIDDIILKLESCMFEQNYRAANILFEEVLEKYSETQKHYFMKFHAQLPKKREYMAEVQREVLAYKRKFRNALNQQNISA